MNSINKINFKIFMKKKININYFSSGFNKIVEQTKKQILRILQNMHRYTYIYKYEYVISHIECWC